MKSLIVEESCDALLTGLKLFRRIENAE